MFTKENALLERFTAGLSALSSQIELKNRIRYLDDNITAEQFVCRLMNILYDADYSSGNGTDGLTAGYDLIWEAKKEVIQVSSSCTGDKIDDANLKTRRAIRDGKLERGSYTLRFVFLTNSASKLRICAAADRAKEELDFSFDPEKDILDFTAFCARVKTEFQFVPERADRLREFMDYCSGVFPASGREKNTPPENKVSKIIRGYASNFEQPLFMHYYTNPRVTLSRMYVDPDYREQGSNLLIPWIKKRRRENRSEWDWYYSPEPELQEYLKVYIYEQERLRDRFLFIEGDAAIGKTSLVSWLCWHYTNKTDIGRSIFGNKKIVCIRLRELDFGVGAKAEEVILHYLGISSIDDFEKNLADALLILDGADELSMVNGIPHGSVEEFLLELQRKFRSHKFIVTTRPLFLEMKRFESSTFSSLCIVLEHYGRALREKWMSKYEACGETIPANTVDYIRSLSDKDENGVAETPLALYLLVQCDAKINLQNNSWALFHQIFSEAISKGEYNMHFSGEDGVLDDCHRSVNYRVVQNIAFRIFRNASEERYYVTSTEIDEAIRECDLDELSPKRVRETCVLCAYWKNVGNLGALEFYHNNIRDFFLCEYISSKLIDCLENREPVNQLIPMLCRILCHADICESTWMQTYEFLCLRLEYESNQADTNLSLYSLINKKQKVLTDVMTQMVSNRDFWNTESDTTPFRGAERVFRNTMMLMRILQSFCHGKIKLWSAESDTMDKELSVLLRDWKEVFSIKPISYKSQQTRQKIINASTDTEYHALDLSEQTVRNVNFDRCCFIKASFKYSRLYQISFRETRILGVDFTSSNVENVAFSQKIIRDARLECTNLLKSSFGFSTLVEWYSRASKFDQCQFHSGTRIVNCVLRQNEFALSVFTNTTVLNSDFALSYFRNTTFSECNFSNVKMKNVRFDGMLKRIKFTNCDFQGSTFKSTGTWETVIFDSCCLTGTSFREVDLSNVRFVNCNLDTTTFGLPNK